MCAAHGVRAAYAQAYHHNANGRAEVAGQQVIRKLSKLITDLDEPGISWVELLPKALRLIHDGPGETGYTQYAVVFGRRRPMAGLPYTIPQKAVDSTVFLERQEILLAKVAHLAGVNQEKRARYENQRRREPPPLAVGSKVWYRPEPRPGRDKLEPTWKGPGIVLERVGNHSYVVEVKKGKRQDAHRSQLRPHVEDTYNGNPFPLHYFSGTAPLVDDLAPDELIPEKVVEHGRDVTGELKLKIRWEGYGPEGDTWEPAGHVVSETVRKYLNDHNLHLTIAPVPPKPKPRPQV